MLPILFARILTAAAEDRPALEQVEGGVEHPVAGAQVVRPTITLARDDLILTDWEGN